MPEDSATPASGEPRDDAPVGEPRERARLAGLLSRLQTFVRRPEIGLLDGDDTRSGGRRGGRA